MYKSPDQNRSVVDQNIPRISLIKTWHLKTVAIIVKQTLKKWKIIIIMYGKKNNKKNAIYRNKTLWIWKFYRTCIKLHLRHIFFWRKENHSAELLWRIMSFCQTEFRRIFTTLTVLSRSEYDECLWCADAMNLFPHIRHADRRHFCNIIYSKSLLWGWRRKWNGSTAPCVVFEAEYFHIRAIVSPLTIDTGFITILSAYGFLYIKLFWKFEMFVSSSWNRLFLTWFFSINMISL